MVKLIIALSVLCIIGYMIHKSIVSPIILFNGIWLVTLLLYNIKMSTIQKDLSERCILCIWCCVIGFNVAAAFKYLMTYVKWNHLLNIKRTIIFTVDQKIKYANYLIIFVFIVELIYSKGCPLIWMLTGSTKSYFQFGIPSLNGALYGLVILLGANALMKKSKWKYFYLGFGLVVVSRQIIMSMVIEGVIIYLFQNPDSIKKVDKKKIAFVIILALVFFGVYGNIRTGESSFNEVFEAREQYENVPTLFKWIYAYMEFAINNFNKLVSITPGGVNKGLSMLTDFLPTVIVKMISTKTLYNPYYLVKINFNVSTYLPSIYLDFGTWGIAVFNAIIGLWGMSLYRKRKQSTKNTIYYAIYVHNILLLLFGNFFLSISIMAQFVYTYIIFTEKKEKG